MALRTSYAPGTFCWIGLNAADPEAASAFYEAMFGWSTSDQGGGYFLFERDGEVAAAMSRMTEGQAAAGLPSAWIVFVSVERAAAAAATATELGGTVAMKPTEVGEAGVMAGILDPQGAFILAWEPHAFAGAEVVNRVGAWSWNDLVTNDVAGASDFYSGLFGWDIAEAPGSGGMYSTICNGGRAIGGVMPTPEGVERPYWVTYFGVDSAPAALDDADTAGGQRLVDPTEVRAGRVAVSQDPVGALFAVYEGQFDD
jgi:predicted enzyme related to lactoylglutathione lyase